MRSFRVRAALVLLLGLLGAVPGRAQTGDDPYVRWDGIRDRFRVSFGAFFVAHQTFANYSTADRPAVPGIDIEGDTRLPKDTTDFRIQGHFKLGRRHTLFGAWYAMNRSAVTTLEGEIEWDDEVFPINAEIASRWNTRVFKFEYRFAVIKRERVDVGLSLGLFALRVESGVGLGSDLGAVETDVEENAPLPMLGGGVEWTFAKGWTLRGEVQYLGLALEETLDGKWGELRAGIEWQPHPNFGLGGGYNFADIDIKLQLEDDLGIQKRLEYRHKFQGPTLYALLTF